MRTSLSHCRERQAELYFILLQPQTFAQDTTAGQLPQYLCWVLLPECDGESWVVSAHPCTLSARKTSKRESHRLRAGQKLC